MIFGDIILLLSVGNGNFAVYGIDGVLRRAKRFSLWDQRNLRVKGVLLTAHGNICAAMLNLSEIGLEFDRIINALTVDEH